MKKYLIVLAVAIVALASCTNEVPVTGISVNPSSIEKFYIGDTVRLGLIVSPAEAKLTEDVKWMSSDTDVVKVVNQNGTVTADYPGEAVVTATAGEFQSACKIYANYEVLFWNLARMYYFPSTKSKEPLNDSVYTVYDSQEGDSAKCQLYSLTFICPNGNDYNEDFSAGEGLCLFANVSVFFPIEGSEEKKASLWGDLYEFTVVDTEEEWKNTPFTTLSGELYPDIVGPIYQDYLEKVDAGDQSASVDWATFLEKGTRGAYIANAEFEEGSVNYSYIRSGLVKEGFSRPVSGGGYDYDLTIQWIVSGWWGLAADWENATSYSNLLVYPYELTPSAMVRYQDGELLGEFLDDEEEEEEEGGQNAPKRSVSRRTPNFGKINLGKPVRYDATNRIAK